MTEKKRKSPMPFLLALVLTVAASVTGFAEGAKESPP